MAFPENIEGSPTDLCRCFLFLGSGNEQHPRSNVGSENRDNFSEAHPISEHAAVSLGIEDHVTDVGGVKAVTQEAAYTECVRKFFMHVRDVFNH